MKEDQDGLEREGIRRSIGNFGELLMLIKTESTIYKISGLEKVPMDHKDILKIPLGEIMDMIKTYKLFR